jgi:ribosomal protein S18 acetylase RimI-like enzyme
MRSNKPAVTLHVMHDRRDFADVAGMMRRLYEEDPAQHSINPRSFARTLGFLLANPSRGSVILLKKRRLLVGYALLIPFWSNEFGGTLLFIDELFVLPEYRGQGIATRFFSRLKRRPPFNAIALALEVTRANRRARKLYRSLGFTPRSNQILILQRTWSAQKIHRSSKANPHALCSRRACSP